MALPPGPRTPLPIATYRWMHDAPRVLDDCYREFGDTFTLRLPAAMLLRPVPIVVTCHPDTIKEVFTGPGEVLHAGKAGRVLAPLVGENSLLVLDGAKHLRHRKLMLPAFHGERVRQYVAAMRDETLDEIRALPSSSELSLHPHLQQITLRVILRTVFGVTDAAAMSELGAQLTRLLDIGSDPSLLLLNFLPVSVGKKRTFDHELAAADRMIYEIIAARRRASEGKTDVLSTLLAARDDDGQPMSDTEVRDELMTLLVAGHETTATALAWTIRLLLEHPEVFERTRSEVDSELDGDINADGLGGLPWLDAVIRESLRLRPVVPMVGRVLQVPMTFRGFRLPAGAAIAPSVWLTHRNPEVYEEPLAFRPERFEHGKPNPYAWLPFGGGIRRCLGQAFALIEMKVVLATLLRHLDLHATGQAPVRIVRRSITFAPSDQTRVIARRRALRAA